MDFVPFAGQDPYDQLARRIIARDRRDRIRNRINLWGGVALVWTSGFVVGLTWGPHITPLLGW